MRSQLNIANPNPDSRVTHFSPSGPAVSVPTETGARGGREVVLQGAAPTTISRPSWGHLVLAYLFPVGLLQTPVGDIYLERAMVLQNAALLRRHAPHYARVHAVLAVGLACLAFATGSATDTSVAQIALLVVGCVESMLALAFTATAIALRLRD